MGLSIPVAGSADRAALVVGVVGVPSDHTMEARRGFSKDVACADQSSHAAAAVGSCGVDAEGGDDVSIGQEGGTSRLSGRSVAVLQIAEN